MKDLPEATELVLAAAAPLEAERVPLAEAAGRVAAEDGRSAVDLPPFDRSAMDGYAVRAADTGAGPLRLAGEIAAGETRDAPLEPGTARRHHHRRADPAGRRRRAAVRARRAQRRHACAPPS